ncbi:MAG: hypothetical protein A2857_06575 [Candidatus Levybacteria bacterium RIFCSPHIGHO2_01_FULL_36_15]|nr:MAG: hypothetical protein A2857_06575 [Candidatus Levybacteria bacterium RIFCSPHIGHO2_01_FULL_36_15]OGH38814.1 MAG: hypothetical protein A2905_02540 [Candidatus Levybacteria bacterium RIFCSPLOWO2_01_FULL_36_10]
MKQAAQIHFSSKVSFLEKLLFTKHLSIMTKSGITLSEAISTLVNQAKSSKFKKVLQDVLADIENGQSFAKSLAKYPKIFDQYYISLIEVGEETGKLDKNLDFLVQQLGKDYTLRKKIQGALLYPGIVLFTTLIMGFFISIFILPKLVDFFNAFEMDLPITTRILIAGANIFKNYGTLIVAGLVATFFIGSMLFNLPSIKPKWHEFILKLPFLGNLLIYSQLTRFSRNLGVLIQSGIPIVQSLDTTANTISNLKFQKDLQEVAKSVTRGKNISDVLSEKGFDEFPIMVVKMIEVGEKTGKLDETLLYLGDFYEDEIDDVSKNLSTLIEPVLLVFIGLVVGFVALAVIGPIYQFMGGMGR